jgi:DNA-binding XRE family transcriptional regulator
VSVFETDQGITPFILASCVHLYRPKKAASLVSKPMPRREDPQIGLAKAIRSLRIEADLSQLELGRRAEIHATWISHIESGRINPTWGNVRRIALGLDVSLSYLAEQAERFERDYS